VTRSLAVIVPVHNDADSIGPFFERARTVLEGLADVSWQLVFANNGSEDSGLDRMRELRAADDRVKIISLSRNFGYQAVLLAGLTLISADLYAMIDVDCEDPPELLGEFKTAIDDGADIAYGIRSNRVEPRSLTFFRRMFYYLNRSVADSDIVVWMSEFAMIRRPVRDAIILPQTTYVFLRAELGYVGFRRVGIRYVRAVRAYGTSHYSWSGMVKFAVAGFLASSTFPLRFILYLAILMGVLFPVIVAVGALGPEGITALAAVAIFYFALVALSTIALYLARTYKNGIARPVFIVDQSRTYL
jgi:glycosyltransferase involved in cell wall biosynthesis